MRGGSRKNMVVAALIYLAITSMIYRCVNPDASETRVLTHIPRSAMLDFRK